MPFPASTVGLDLTPMRRPLTTRDVLAYAAGLGASEDVFMDDARAGGLDALPFQCVSLEWPVLLSSRAQMAGRLTEDEARRGVHAIQDSQFHKPLRPGQEFETSGRLVLARKIKAGVFTTHKLTTRERTTGDLVTTSWSSSIYRGVALDEDDTTIDAPPEAPVSLTQALDEAATTRSISIAREAPHIYTECADIWNPIHTERSVALAAGLPDIILHGTATWALAGLEILRAHAGSEVARLKRMSGRFVGMIIPGETIRVRHARDRERPEVIRFDVLTQSGAAAIDQGFAVLS